MTNVEALQRVMQFIKDNPEKHDQGVWMTECGTAACLAGWTVLLEGARPRQTPGCASVRRYTEDCVYQGHRNKVSNLAQKILGLSDIESGILFDSDNSQESLELMIKDLSNGDSLRDNWVFDNNYGTWIRRNAVDSESE